MLAYSLNKTVDAVQTAKKTWVNNCVFDSKLADHLNRFVDTQTEYTKATFNNFEQASMAISGYTIGKAQESAKTAADWVNKLSTKS